LSKFRWLAVPVIAVALVSAACGGDEDTGDAGDATETTTATEATTEATTAATTAATTEATATATEAAGGDAADLASIFEGFATATFNVTYNLESEDPEQDMAGEWTWIQDNDGNRTRFEIDSEGETVIMITTADQSIVCAEDACFDAGGAMGGAIPNIGDMFNEGIEDVQADASTATVRPTDGREIAGTDTECVEFEDEAEGVSGLACYAEGGIPLLIESETPDGNFRMEATSFSTDVSDEDFEPPFEVMSLGG